MCIVQPIFLKFYGLGLKFWGLKYIPSKTSCENWIMCGQEWSERRLKSVRGDMIFMPSRMDQCDASFSIELKCFSSNLKHRSHPLDKTGRFITLFDQLLFLLCLYFLYQFSHLFLTPLYKWLITCIHDCLD